MNEIATPAGPETMTTLTFRGGSSVQTLHVPRGATLLEIAVEADTPLEFVCCRGVCGTCLVRVKQGAQNLSDKTAAEQKLLTALSASDDARLACQCSILGDAEIEPLDESGSN